MMTAGDKSRLIADIVTAEDEASIVDALTRNLGVLGTLKPRELEDFAARLQDAIAENRAHRDD